MSKAALIRTMEEGAIKFEQLGFVVWWSINKIDIPQADLVKTLEACGLPVKYAREHNWRSSLIRSLKNMEEQHLIRKVDEDDTRLIYQFTAEIGQAAGTEEAHLDYKPETRIIVNKDAFQATGDFAASITKCDPQIKEIVVKHFYEEKVRFKSADFSRIIHRIFENQADIIALRDQGNIYYVPTGYKGVLDQVAKLAGLVSVNGGSCKLEALPLPDCASSRLAVKQAFEEEVSQFLKTLDGEIYVVQQGAKKVTDKWVDNKGAKINALRNRLELYATLLENDQKTLFEAGLEILEKKLFAGRKLDLG